MSLPPLKPVPVRAADAAWLRMEEPTNPMTITGVMSFGTRVEAEDLAALLEERLLPFDRFRMRVENHESRNARWVPSPHVDIWNHLIPTEIPAPGGKKGLERLVSDLMSEPLSFEHSPWTFHLVQDVDDEIATAFVARLHHVIGDGIGLMHVLLSMCDERFDPEKLPGGALAPKRRPKRPARQRLAQTLRGAAAETRDLLTRPRHLAQRLKVIGGGIGSLGGLLAMSRDSETVFKGAASPRKQAAWTRAIDLDLIKKIGHATGSKVNDVLLAAATGAIRRYLISQGERIGGVDFRVVVPVNVRPMERAHEMGNAFSLVFLELPVGVADPIERLRQLKAGMDALKDSQQPAVVYGILNTIGVAPDWGHQFVLNLFATKSSAVVTNVPGPTTELHWGGAPIRELMFWVPQAGDVGLGLSILSYAGSVRVGVAADHAYAPDPVPIVDAFEQEFAELAAQYA
ncbi:MAG: wax ester/triacylglycerol synthase family O-acyltransferase [Bacteroidota bacterium]